MYNLSIDSQRWNIRRYYQERTLEWLIIEWFNSYRDEFLAAARLIDVRTQLTEEIEDHQRFDPWLMYKAYWIMAGIFRIFHPDIDQLELPFEESDHDEKVAMTWINWFREQRRNIARNHPDFVRIFLVMALSYKDPERQHKIAEIMCHMLLSYYEYALPSDEE